MNRASFIARGPAGTRGSSAWSARRAESFPEAGEQGDGPAGRPRAGLFNGANPSRTRAR